MDLDLYNRHTDFVGKRALPALPTNTPKAEETKTEEEKDTKTTEDDHASKTDDNDTSTKKTKLPGITTATAHLPGITTATDTASSYKPSTTSYTTPLIEYPSAKGNPNIWYSNKPSGTVFIAVGGVAGLIFLAVLLWLFVNSWISYSQAKQMKKYNNVEKQFQNPFMEDMDFSSSGGAGGGYYKADDELNSYSDDISRSKHTRNSSFSPYKRASHSMIKLLGGSTDDRFHDPNSSVGNIGIASLNPMERTDPIEAANMDLRKSLYISPTMEVMNQQRRSTLFNNLNQSAISIDSPTMREPTRTVSPERRAYKHERNKSSLGKLVDSTIDLTATTNFENDRSGQEHSNSHKKSNSITPSMYLENMLKDNT